MIPPYAYKYSGVYYCVLYQIFRQIFLCKCGEANYYWLLLALEETATNMHAGYNYASQRCALHVRMIYVQQARRFDHAHGPTCQTQRIEEGTKQILASTPHTLHGKNERTRIIRKKKRKKEEKQHVGNSRFDREAGRARELETERHRQPATTAATISID